MYGRPQWLDREECFRLWCELGSIKRVCMYLERDGIVNPTTLEAPSDSGVRFAAYKHMLYNPEEARKEYMKLGVFLDGKNDHWISHLEKWARALLTTRRERYEEWREWIQPYIKNLEKN